MRIWAKLSKVGWLAVLGLVLVMVTASGALATTITVLNPSFEAQQPPTGWTTTTDGYWTKPPFTITGWTYNGTSPVLAGLLHPITTTWMNYVPDGENVAYIDEYVYLSQILTTNLAANTQYTLTVDVGRRGDSTLYGGYIVQLGIDNGGSFVLLEEDNNTQTPTAGNFVSSTVNYDSSGSSYVGKPLEVRLYVPAQHQTLFDDIRLEGTTVPLPSTLLLLSSGLVGLGLLRRKWSLKK